MQEKKQELRNRWDGMSEGQKRPYRERQAVLVREARSNQLRSLGLQAEPARMKQGKGFAIGFS